MIALDFKFWDWLLELVGTEKFNLPDLSHSLVLILSFYMVNQLNLRWKGAVPSYQHTS